MTVALEVLIPMPHILLMGGGHCAKAIAEACLPLDWKYSVQDSRADYATLEGATETHHSCPKISLKVRLKKHFHDSVISFCLAMIGKKMRNVFLVYSKGYEEIRSNWLQIKVEGVH